MQYFLKFGQAAPVNAEGDFVDGALTVEYELEGTRYILKVEPRKVLHKTVGDGLEVEFIHGKRTVGVLKCGNSSAPYPVFCSMLKIAESGLNRDITVVFNDGDCTKTVNIKLISKCAD